MTEPRLRRAVATLFQRMQAQIEAARAFEANAYIVEICDPETSVSTLNGPFHTAPEAAAWADQHIAEFTALDDGVPLQATIRPLYHP